MDRSFLNFFLSPLLIQQLHILALQLLSILPILYTLRELQASRDGYFLQGVEIFYPITQPHTEAKARDLTRHAMLCSAVSAAYTVCTCLKILKVMLMLPI